MEAIRNCKVPVFFVHGEADDFVPCQMSRDCSEACPQKHMLHTVAGAGHGLAYLIDPQGYIAAASQLDFPAAEN